VMMTDQVSPGVIASAVSVGHVVVEEAADGWGSGTVGPTEERRTTRGSVRKGGRGGARNSSHHHPFGASIVCSSEESAVVPHEALRSYPWGRSGEGRDSQDTSRAEQRRGEVRSCEDNPLETMAHHLLPIGRHFGRYCRGVRRG
jgi:hypothetical protein